MYDGLWAALRYICSVKSGRLNGALRNASVFLELSVNDIIYMSSIVLRLMHGRFGAVHGRGREGLRKPTGGTGYGGMWRGCQRISSCLKCSTVPTF